MTDKLYEQDSHLKEFPAIVTACEPHGELFYISLNQTAHPEAPPLDILNQAHE